ncbi:MAG: polyprenol monophosphomannose synthase [Chloroflexi bacterium]|nr:polyprenol monophosphomannose synthase [Chloroflexota bacterium]
MHSTSVEINKDATNGKVQVSIVVPTYNERENIPVLCEKLRRTLDGRWTYEIIVVDDNSPDGTGEVVRQLAQDNPAIKLLERPGKLGIGTAFIDGIRHALSIADSDIIITMDADMSHDPGDLPRIIAAAGNADLVQGSRYIQGGKVIGWSLRRKLQSLTANAMCRFLLGTGLRENTTSYRAYSRKLAERLLCLSAVKGYEFLPLVALLARREKYRIVEVAITFVDRRLGQSKTSLRVIVRWGVCILAATLNQRVFRNRSITAALESEVIGSHS